MHSRFFSIVLAGVLFLTQIGFAIAPASAAHPAVQVQVSCGTGQLVQCSDGKSSGTILLYVVPCGDGEDLTCPDGQRRSHILCTTPSCPPKHHKNPAKKAKH